jgi:hypothetical protein
MVLISANQDEVRDSRLYMRQATSQQAENSEPATPESIEKGTTLKRINGRAISFEYTELHETNKVRILDLATDTSISVEAPVKEGVQTALDQGLQDLSGRLHEKGICWNA